MPLKMHKFTDVGEERFVAKTGKSTYTLEDVWNASPHAASDWEAKGGAPAKFFHVEHEMLFAKDDVGLEWVWDGRDGWTEYDSYYDDMEKTASSRREDVREWD